MNSAPSAAIPRIRVWHNASLATLAGDPGLGLVRAGVVIARGERLVFAGPAHSAPPLTDRDVDRIDCGGRWITPGLIDCHTHLVHAGHRADEFEKRLEGATYAEIAASGGGIVAS